MVWSGVGVAVIEVKGGHVEYADGTWWVGRPHQSRAVQPVKQALKCKYCIRKVLRRHPRWSGGDPRMVRHLAADGERVALLCYSKGLAMWLLRRVQTLPDEQRPAYVGTFHALGIQWGARPVAGTPQEYWESGLPAEMTRHARFLT